MNVVKIWAHNNNKKKQIPSMSAILPISWKLTFIIIF